ncbi:hypothetical protein BJ912DRAFT_1048865 [Pholiota molesta]|nr:hypothetical protein BJ912DRAFT_1048865 [Pholiota molesta]
MEALVDNVGSWRICRDPRHPGLAKFYAGEDVCFPGGRRRITAHTLRSAFLDVNGTHDGGAQDVVLHWVLFNTRGRPLWEYRSEKELLLGIRAALSAHQILCEQGIVHRDINAGNIMLSAETMPEAGAEGFLLDLDCASVAGSSAGIVGAAVPQVTYVSGGGTDSAIDGAAWSGTAPFMAADISRAIVMNAPIKHEPKHDIEPIIYVLGYALTRHLLLDAQASELDPSAHERLRRFFRAMFGQISFDDQWMLNRVQAPLGVVRYSEGLLSEAMVELLEVLDSWLAQARLRPEYGPKALTHADALLKLDAAIAQMG